MNPAPDSRSEPNSDAADTEAGEEEVFWSLTAGQRLEEGVLNANCIPRAEWEAALDEADGDEPNGFVILQAPSGDYVQTMAEPEGYALEYREFWPREVSPGFRHYRARRPDAEGEPPLDAKAEATWMVSLDTVKECFECFTEYPDETPELTDGQWVDVTEEFPPAGG